MKQGKGVLQGDMWENSEMYEAKEGSSTRGYVEVQGVYGERVVYRSTEQDI